MAVNGPDHVFAKAQEFGMTFQVDRTDAGLALALGVQEVRPVDLVTAYGTLANGGRNVGSHDDPGDPGQPERRTTSSSRTRRPKGPRSSARRPPSS